MKEFLIQLAFGINTIPKKYKDLYEEIRSYNAIDEIIQKANKEKKYLYKLKPDFVIGNVDISREKIGFLSDFRNKQMRDLRLSTLLSEISQNDIILAKIIKIKGKNRANPLLVLYKQQTQTLCYLEKVKGKIQAIALKNTKTTFNLNASQKSLQALPKHAVLSIDPQTKEIKEILGVLQDPKIDEKISLHIYNRVQNFSFEAQNLAESFGKEVDPLMYPDRKDLTHIAFCTIDPNDAKDHDDAIFFDSSSHKLYIAIADVSEYVSPQSSLDLEAKERGFSLYLPHKSYPMLPKNLSENICSLKQNKVRLAFVWELRLHRRTFEILDSQLFNALIINHQNITYEEVDKLLMQEKISINKKVRKSILDFHLVAKKIRTKRLKKGFDFFNDELKMKLDENGFLQNIETSLQGDSHTIVEEAMLLANKSAASLLQKYVPDTGIYRVHNQPTQEKIKLLMFDLKNLGYEIKSKDFHQNIQSIQKQAEKKQARKQIDKLIIKSQSQAMYSTHNIGHFGLGFEKYTHFTSPIRRYSDLVLHRILKEILNPKSDKKLSYLLNTIESSCILLNELERQITKIEFDFKDRKYTRWAGLHIGIKLKAMIMDEHYPPLAMITEKITGARVILDILPSECNKFDEIFIKITKADLPSSKIYAKVWEK